MNIPTNNADRTAILEGTGSNPSFNYSSNTPE